MRIDRTAPVPPTTNHVRDDAELRHRLAGKRIDDPSIAELQQLTRSRAPEPTAHTSRRRHGRR